MEQDLALLLPDDLLADVLRRVAPRDLAVSRCVCRAWRALIDEHGLLRTDLLPLSLAGLFLRFAFVEYHEIEYAEPELFARPPVDIAYSMPTDLYDHCNGLILEYESVFNPATGGRAPLPDPPVSSRLELDDWRYFYFHQHLAFDPTVSPHYEVFMVPYVRYYFRLDVLPTDNVLLLQSEWPPSLWVLRVLSSRTGRWQERSFVREGEAAGTVAGLRSSCASDHAVYCRDALYIHCQKDFVVRLSLSDHKCRVINPPNRTGIECRKDVHLGKSEKGVYCALLDKKYNLWVWILQGSGEQMEWTMKHHSNALDLPSLNYHQRVHNPWILLQNANNNEVPVEHERNTDDNESILRAEDRVQNQHPYYFYMEILGFHPYKEIVFLHTFLERGLAYHLNSSKLEDLGNLNPKNYRLEHLEHSFPYTPCRTGDL